MASKVDISNLALQMLGAGSITAFPPTDTSREAKACNNCYEMLRDKELRVNRWGFAKKRAVLAPDATAPAFSFLYAFTYPADCLRPLRPTGRNDCDWQFEGGKILTNDGDTLNLVYIARITDTSMFDAAFVEALAAKMAWHMCEQITQSNTKKADALRAYDRIIAEAKLANSIEQIPEDPADDLWITARL